MNTYEITCIFPTREEEVASGRDAIKTELTKVQANVLKETDMGERVLAYPVKKQTRGHYILFEAEIDPSKIIELDKIFKLQSNILKYLFIKKE